MYSTNLIVLIPNSYTLPHQREPRSRDTDIGVVVVRDAEGGNDDDDDA